MVALNYLVRNPLGLFSYQIVTFDISYFEKVINSLFKFVKQSEATIFLNRLEWSLFYEIKHLGNTLTIIPISCVCELDFALPYKIIFDSFVLVDFEDHFLKYRIHFFFFWKGIFFAAVFQNILPQAFVNVLQIFHL